MTPAPLPRRFHNEVRLGRSGPAEVWLATDTTLELPVLVELLGPEIDERLRRDYVARVRAAAAIDHIHLATVYAADAADNGAYAVTEWAGGVTVADRISAGEPVPVDDFLPNAAGLADALAALHRAGIVHGAVAPDTILFSAAHPAKLTGFGRGGSGGPREDTRALAEALTAGLAGGATDLPPSQIATGLSPSVDRALAAATRGELDAAGLAAALRAAPSATTSRPRQAWSWRWVPLAVIALLVGAGVIAIGFAIESRVDSPFLFPAGPPPSTAPPPPLTAPPEASPDVTAGAASPVAVGTAQAYDPFGDGSERDGDVRLVVDGDTGTSWRTERYFDPLRLIKPGVGVIIPVDGSPGTIELLGTAGTGISVRWAPALPSGFDGWQEVAAVTLQEGSARVEVPGNDGGVWLIWLTDLPSQEAGQYFYAFLNEVRFIS